MDAAERAAMLASARPGAANLTTEPTPAAVACPGAVQLRRPGA